MVGNAYDQPTDGPPEKTSTWKETLAAIFGAIIVCFLIGAAAVAYLFLEIIPSLNH